MERKQAEHIVLKLKRVIEKEFQNQHLEETLRLISLCADVLYNTNIYYMDPELESSLQKISGYLLSTKKCADIAADADADVVFFYDGFGLDNRGLAQIYLKAIGTEKKLCYVTYKHRSREIPETLSLVQSLGGSVCFLDSGKYIEQIHQLNSFLQSSKAGHFFLYAYPSDVVATTLLYSYEGLLKRYQINLTDHAFWLGAGCLDTCIEFRDYGGSISLQYRNIPEHKLAVLPFYPRINREQPFQGFPFPVTPENKVIFSGGALYKTLGKENKYYEIVDHLLAKHRQAIFWYAGTGDDTQMRKLMDKYPSRLFLTEERKDLFQLLQQCYFYLNTYPISGGLMYQYAACAGKLPLTLRISDDNSGILLNQEQLGIDFETPEEVMQEIDRLMEDEIYAEKKSALMKDCVISQEKFQKELAQILQQGFSTYRVINKSVDAEVLQQTCLEQISPADIRNLFAQREYMQVIFRHYPILFFQGMLEKAVQKIKNKFL